MANTYTLISSVTVGSGGTSSVSFTSIPSTYTDLVFIASAKSNRNDSNDWCEFKINGNNMSNWILLLGNGASPDNYKTGSGLGISVGSTSGYFSNTQIYIPNYAGSNNKSFNAESIQENNTTTAYLNLFSGIRNDTNPVTSVSLAPIYGTAWLQYSTFYLYGISNA